MEGVTCQISGCASRVKARGYCDRHYTRWHRHGDPLASAYDSRPPKPKYLDVNGYVRIGKGSIPKTHHHYLNGRNIITEHRYVMSCALGRPLQPDESVHHKNGDRTDNHISNLELWTRAHPYGQRVTDALEAAHDLINRYEGTPKSTLS